LIFKAKYAAEHCPGDYNQDVLDSVIDDLVVMVGMDNICNPDVG
jgi:hypothetical protein